MRLDWIGTAFAGALLVSRRPGLLLAWTLVLVAALFVYLGLMVALLAGQQGLVASATKNPLAVMPFVLPLVLGLATVLGTAVYRAILEPERSRFAYLRLGADEARMVVFFLGVIACIVLVTQLPPTPGWGVFASVALVVVSSRASLIGAAIYHRRRLDLMAGWRIAEGRYWSLLGMNLIIWAVFHLMHWMVRLAWSGFVEANIAGYTDPAMAGPAFTAKTLIASIIVMIYYTALFVVATAPAAAAYRFFAIPPKPDSETDDQPAA